MVKLLRLTDAQQDKLLVSRFKLDPDEVAAGVKLRTFARDGLGIELHVGQVAFAGFVLARHLSNPRLAKFHTLVLASGNRAGKTSLLAILIIYSCLRKLNKDTPTSIFEAEKWAKSEYHWYHFGISQEVADLVYSDVTRILTGLHEGQLDGCPMQTQLGTVATWEVKEYSEYRWIKFTEQLGGAQIHFRTTGEKALSSLGKDIHGLSFDEAGIEKNLDFLIKEVFNMRRIGTGGQLLMVSTPSEDIGTFFAEKWEQGNPASEDKLTGWRSMRMSTRDNIGYGLTQDRFDILVEDMGPREIMQQIEGIFLQGKTAYFNGENVELAFASGMPDRIAAQRGGTYLQGCDPAKSNDSMWALVLKLVENPNDPDRPYLVGVRAEQKQGQKSTPVMVALAANGFRAYDSMAGFQTATEKRLNPLDEPAALGLGSHCYTGIDATGFGGKMFREALEKECPNLYNVEFGGTVQTKRKLLGNLRTIIDEGRLLLPRTGIWLIVRRQLLGYKLEDRGIAQDAVMALVCAVYLVKRAPLDGMPSVAVDM
jgi:hypothetical protein